LPPGLVTRQIAAQIQAPVAQAHIATGLDPAAGESFGPWFEGAGFAILLHRFCYTALLHDFATRLLLHSFCYTAFATGLATDFFPNT
jgi:hypothetical protein